MADPLVLQSPSINRIRSFRVPSTCSRTAHREWEKGQAIEEIELPRTGESDSNYCEIREILIRNGDTFAIKSAFLDSLLAFAGLFSAVLAAFRIEVHKGLQEDLLTQILQKLRTEPDPSLPYSISVFVSALWWMSINVSLSAALFIIVAKGMGSRVIDRSEARALTEARNVQEFNRLLARSTGRPLDLTRAHLSFVRVFEVLVRTSTVLLAVSLLLFYPGLIILVYHANRGIALGTASIATATTVTGVLCI